MKPSKTALECAQAVVSQTIRGAGYLAVDIPVFDELSNGAAKLIDAHVAEAGAEQHKAIARVVRGWKLSYTEDEQGGGLSLVDRLTPDGDGSITRGKEEIELLLDELFAAQPPEAP